MLDRATIAWRIPYFLVQEQYYVEYGENLDNLDQTSSLLLSPENATAVNQEYTTILLGLNSGTLYYLRVAAVFDIVIVRYSEVFALVTKEQGKLKEGSTYSCAYVIELKNFFIHFRAKFIPSVYFNK